MLRVIVIFIIVAFMAAAFAWFADQPGELTVNWLGYEIRTSFMLAVGAVLLGFFAILFVWTIARGVLGAPGLITNFFRARRQARGLEALTKGVVAAGAGDAVAATRYASLAHRALGNEPLAQLLRAQAAQLSGDRTTVHRVFDTMLQSPETEVLGLRGLFVQAQQEGNQAQARRHAERALQINPRLSWAAHAVLAMQSAAADWVAAERTVEDCRKNKLFEAHEAARKTAVVATARAMALEETEPEAAIDLALRAHKLAPQFVPAAVIAGRLLAATDQSRKAAKVLEKTWRLAPHPDLAEVYGAAYTGRSPRDRLKRVKALVAKAPAQMEGPIAIATAALEARQWDEAREALEALIGERPSARVCALMAEIEHGENANEGRAREWLAKAMYAPRDPAWIADGQISQEWRPVSPLTGELDGFEWKAPADDLATRERAGPPALTDGQDRADEALDEPHSAVEEMTNVADTSVVPEATAEDGKLNTAVAETAEPVEDAPAQTAIAAETPEPQAPDADVGKAAAEPRQPKIFVPPHAPDDPGPEPREKESGNWFQMLFAR